MSIRATLCLPYPPYHHPRVWRLSLPRTANRQSQPALALRLVSAYQDVGGTGLRKTGGPVRTRCAVDRQSTWSGALSLRG